MIVVVLLVFKLWNAYPHPVSIVRPRVSLLHLDFALDKSGWQGAALSGFVLGYLVPISLNFAYDALTHRFMLRDQSICFTLPRTNQNIYKYVLWLHESIDQEESVFNLHDVG